MPGRNYGRIRVERDVADDLYWAIYWHTSNSIADKILVRDAGGDVEPLQQRLKHLHRLRDELKRMYSELGWEWPGRDEQG